MFRKLLENHLFVEHFRVRYLDLVRHDLAYVNTYPAWQKIRQALEAEIPSQVERFGAPTSLRQWSLAMSRVQDFLSDRPFEAYAELLRFLVNHTEIARLSCFPNPSQGDFTVSFDAETSGMASLAIYNLQGGCVFKQSFSVEKGPNHKLVTIHLSAGVYVVSINQHCEKIVVF